jgi:hypothetical protein
VARCVQDAACVDADAGERSETNSMPTLRSSLRGPGVAEPVVALPARHADGPRHPLGDAQREHGRATRPADPDVPYTLTQQPTGVVRTDCRHADASCHPAAEWAGEARGEVGARESLGCHPLAAWQSPLVLQPHESAGGGGRGLDALLVAAVDPRNVLGVRHSTFSMPLPPVAWTTTAVREPVVRA